MTHKFFLVQSVESSKGKLRLNSSVEAASIQSIRSRVPGNGFCADCDAPSKYLFLFICETA